MKKITINIPDKLYKKIGYASTFSGRSRSKFVRLAAERFTDAFLKHFEEKLNSLGNGATDE